MGGGGGGGKEAGKHCEETQCFHNLGGKLGNKGRQTTELFGGLADFGHYHETLIRKNNVFATMC